ncbi:MAG: PilZ domain-containing protein [Desulfobacterales bacterium]|jgi:Tfp pilus assembly protein PilZ
MQPENVVYLHERGANRVIDLRRFARKPFRRATIFACQNRYYAGLTKNISKGGIFIETRNPFAIGQIITLVISRTKIEKGVMLKGEVVHRKAEGFGLKFLSLLKNGKEFKIKF